MRIKDFTKYQVLLALVILGLSVNAQNPSALFSQYKTALENNEEPTLPNFSFVGYHHGEKSIPKTLPHQVFDVTDAKYGADKTGTTSSNAAIRAAIADAEANGSGVVYFPEGTYIVLDYSDNQTTPITIGKSNIVLKGDGPDKTTLYQKAYTTHSQMEAKDWACPYFIEFKPSFGGSTKITDVTADARRETFSIQVSSVSGISKDQWVRLSLTNNNPSVVAKELSPYAVSDLHNNDVDASNLKIQRDGVIVHEIHQVASVDSNTKTVTFVEPIHKSVTATEGWILESHRVIEEVGIQDLKYKGGFTWKHHHHRNPDNNDNFNADGTDLDKIWANYKFLGSSGWSGIVFDFVVNGWMTNVEFTETSQCVQIRRSANFSAIKNKYTGNPVHNFITAHSSTGCLIGLNTDESTAGVWHGCGMNAESIGNVLWRNDNPYGGGTQSGVEVHASQIRATLVDKCTGGMFKNMGGSKGAMPNHLSHMVLWNFEGVSYTNSNVMTWRTDSDYSKFLPPIVSGLKGFTFKTTTPKQYQENESPGVHVDETSLYEAQLKHRLGSLPTWVVDELTILNEQAEEEEESESGNTVLSVDPAEQGKYLKIYPNPARTNDTINIHIGGDKKNFEADIIIRDLSGKPVVETKRYKVNNNSVSLPGNIPQGTYLLTILVNGQHFKGKLVMR